MRQAEFNDPRLVAVYDAECGWSGDDDFFLSVVTDSVATGRGGGRVLDLGCGTGRLALGIAAAGYDVTGVDPARASLAAARVKPGADAVTWVEGTAADLPDAGFDVALMTSHVAQFLVADAEWDRTLADLHRALVPGGVLVFDSRDPRDRRWERWNPTESRRRVALPAGDEVEVWTTVEAEREAVVDFTMHYRFAGGDELASTATLRFRSEDELRLSLARSGFSVDAVHGGWGREPVGHPDGELLVTARAIPVAGSTGTRTGCAPPARLS